MNLFDKLFRTNKNKNIKEDAKINNKNYKNYLIKVKTFLNKSIEKRETFHMSEFDLEEIKLATMTDSYISTSLQKYKNLFFKNGAEFKGENEKAIEYLKTRFRVMSFSTRKPMDILFMELGDDLLQYSNCFLVKVRVDRIPFINAKGIFAKNPVGGYFRVDPAQIQIKKKNGEIVGYKQINDEGEERDYKVEDVLHFYIDKDPGNNFGTPRLLPALEDVKLLRKVEGIIVALIYRFALPLMHAKVGPTTPNAPGATKEEIEDAKNQLENMSLDSMFISSNRVEIDSVGAKSQALDAKGYLDYFEKRAFTALLTSESQMGRGGAKQDSDSMEQQVHDYVKYVQRIFSIFVENFILSELLLEGGFNPVINEKDIVKYEFNEISLDTKIKLENHELLKYQSNLTTFEEARRNIGKKANINNKDLYVNKIDKQSLENQINVQLKADKEMSELNFKHSQKMQKNMQNNLNNNIPNNDDSNISIDKNKSNKNNDTKKDLNNRNMPQNQHGIYSVKIKESADNKIQPLKKNKKFNNISKLYKITMNDIINTKENIKIILNASRSSILSEMKELIEKEIYLGATDAAKKLNGNYYPQIYSSTLNEVCEITLKRIFKDIENKLNKTSRKAEEISNIFNSTEYRIQYLLEYILPKAYWYGYLKEGNYLGYKEAFVNFDSEKDEEENNKRINTDNFSLKDIPAFHSFCKCSVYFKKK